MRSSKRIEGIYTFAKLNDIEDYKEWAWEIRFALLDIGLIAYANGRSSKFELYTKVAISPRKKSALLTKEKIEK